MSLEIKNTSTMGEKNTFLTVVVKSVFKSSKKTQQSHTLQHKKHYMYWFNYRVCMDFVSLYMLKSFNVYFKF